MTRPDAHGKRLYADPPSRRGGATELRAVVARGADGTVLGFARYAIKAGWSEHLPTGSITVWEVMALTTPAEAALWRWLLDTDLVVTATAQLRPAVDPLALLLADRRRMAPTLGEGLYVRVIDVPGGVVGPPFQRATGSGDRRGGRVPTYGVGPLSGRRGRPPIRLPSCPPAPGSPTCGCPSRRWGAAHLGSVAFTDLAVGGEIEELTPGALVSATRAWSWHVPAWAPEPF